jgi:hypothetical protein
MVPGARRAHAPRPDSIAVSLPSVLLSRLSVADSGTRAQGGVAVTATNFMAVGVLILSVVATFRVARRGSGARGESTGSHRPVGRGRSLDFVTAGRRVSRSNRRILSPARTVRPHGGRPRSGSMPVTVTLPGHSASTPSEPRYV